MKKHFVKNGTWIELPKNTPKKEIKERIEKLKEKLEQNVWSLNGFNY